MNLIILKERNINEKRVSIIPNDIGNLKKIGFNVFFEKNAGLNSGYNNEDYINAGAIEVDNIKNHYDIAVCIQEIPSFENLDKKTILIGNFNYYINKELLENSIFRNIFSLDLMPRISRAQSMDILSSQSNILGYLSVLESTRHINKILPMFITSAGTISAAKYMIIGAGVAGLQAIATAKRLGAIVTAYDSRDEAKEQAESLGAKFIKADKTENSTIEFIKKLNEQDVVICTALPVNQKAPIILNREILNKITRELLIIDLAISNGGNCELSQDREVTKYNKLSIIGFNNLISNASKDASKLYSRNIINFLDLLQKNIKKEDDNISIQLQDEIIEKTLIKNSQC